MVGAALFEKHRSGAIVRSASPTHFSAIVSVQRGGKVAIITGVLFVILALFLSSSSLVISVRQLGMCLSFFKTVTLLRFGVSEAAPGSAQTSCVCAKFCPTWGKAISMLPPAYTQTQLQGMGSRTVGNRLVFLKPQVIA